MIYYKTIELPFHNDLVNFININFTDSLLKKKNYIAQFIERSDIEPNLLEKIETYFQSKGLEFSDILMFFRNNVDRSEMHVDFLDQSQTWKTSLVVPIVNFQNTFMYWFDGKYDLSMNISHGNVPYFDVHWREEKKLVEETEILGPTICRTDIPHGARSSSEDITRLVATLRFTKNFTFEEIVEKLA